MMRSAKSIPSATLFFLVIISIALELSSCTIDNHTGHKNIQCPETEKQALLSFKQSLEDPYGLLSSWNNRSSEVNCCSWKGIVCGKFTGHVQQLRLQNNYDPDYIESSVFLSGKITHSLLNLTQLRYLDLSSNNFTGRIPSFIGSFSSLWYLNLSNAGFHGAVPHSIGNLSNLCTLDLGEVWMDDRSSLYANSVEWLSGLSKLEHLNMNRVNLSRAGANWAPLINSLPPLVELHFSDCSLNFISEGSIPSISNTTKLQHIDLSYNKFNSTIPGWLYSCKDLHYVNLDDNLLQGTISSAIANLSSLNTLKLSYNELSGNIPREIANLCKMQALTLYDNKLRGELSDSFGNMSDCFLDSLQYLSVGGNQLSGHITDEFGEFKSLKLLRLSRNLLSGPIPPSLGHLMSLEVLCLHRNKLDGVVTESHFANLTILKYLDASDNHQLSLKVSPNWNLPFQLTLLRLGSWKLGTTNIPSWLNTQKNLDLLDLSSTGILGVVPNWIWGIKYLNLSHNNFHGKIPNKFGNSSVVFLSSNQFSGPLPRAGSSLVALDLSNNSFSGGLSHFLCDNITNLEILLLDRNKLTGELPDCFMKCPSLRILELGNNGLSGSIPNSIRFLTNLIYLNLYRNNISGRIPVSMRNCTELVKIDLHENNLVGDIPTWIGKSLTKLMILILRSNKLSGEISSDICLLNSLQILDLSDNRISGIIPSCVHNFIVMVTKRYPSILLYPIFIGRTTLFTKGRQYQYDTILSLVTNMDLSNNNLSGDIPKGLTNLEELRSLNLSGNHLTGLIPNSIGDMKQLESLDFSMNSLSGGIPHSFTTMSFLNCLDLSYNNLTGRIPESTQFNTFNASSFIGNQLCGPPLTRNCSSNGEQVPAPGNTEEHGAGKSNVDWFYVFVSSGFAMGFSATCLTLMLNKSRRDAYFGFVEDTWDKLYVFCYVKWRMLAGR